MEIEIRDFITGKEFKQLQETFVAGASLGEGNTLKANDPSVFLKMQDEAVKMLVLSVAGVRENILDAVEALRQEDYQQILDKVNAITSGMGEEKKTN